MNIFSEPCIFCFFLPISLHAVEGDLIRADAYSVPHIYVIELLLLPRWQIWPSKATDLNAMSADSVLLFGNVSAASRIYSNVILSNCHDDFYHLKIVIVPINASFTF
jgi:hypothetical protein